MSEHILYTALELRLIFRHVKVPKYDKCVITNCSTVAFIQVSPFLKPFSRIAIFVILLLKTKLININEYSQYKLRFVRFKRSFIYVLINEMLFKVRHPKLTFITISCNN